MREREIVREREREREKVSERERERWWGIYLKLRMSR
jgi:hypothetical protein